MNGRPCGSHYDPRAHPMMDYRHEIWGMGAPAVRQPLLPSHGLEGLDLHGPWERVVDSVVCEAGEEGARILFGNHEWCHYEVQVQVVAEKGGNVQIPFRLAKDGRSGYMVDLLLGWQAIAISRFEHGKGVEKLSVVNCQLDRGREYHIELSARGRSLTTYVDGLLMNQVTAGDQNPGRFALQVWCAKTRFRNPTARRLG